MQVYCSKLLFALLLNRRGSDPSAILPRLKYQTARMIHPHLKRNQGEKRAAHCNLALLRMCMCICPLVSPILSTVCPLAHPLALLQANLVLRHLQGSYWLFFWFFVLLFMLCLVSLHRKGILLRTKANLPLGKLITMMAMIKLLPPHPLQALPLCILRTCEFHGFMIGSLVDFCSSMPKQPNVNKSQFSIIPFDNEHGPSNCPQHLLFTNEEGVVGPVEVIPGCFDIFRDTSWL